MNQPTFFRKLSIRLGWFGHLARVEDRSCTWKIQVVREGRGVGGEELKKGGSPLLKMTLGVHDVIRWK
jgi:hypothetical protein